MDEREQSIIELEALLKVPGALKIITSEVRSDLRVDPDDPRSPAREGVDLRDPRSFVLHDVVRIEGPNERGQYVAFSAEGDSCVGYPEHLLRRLREWRG